MALDPRRVKALFNSALDLPDPAERSSFLDRECGDDPELRRRLVDLLAAYDRPASALEGSLTVDPDAAASPLATEPDQAAWADRPGVDPEQTEASSPDGATTSSIIGAVIAGRYTIREEIGEGGMGSVYLADQIKPVKRRVAVKLIKAGMDTRTVLARFESERQALALMDHPNIAKVFDAGGTETGRPFFVMELVEGVPLTDYCDQNRLSLPERLTLFRQICSAVQHAHQKGIIHRDLKPTNILVESHDGVPVPKVIDFGLAKAVGGQALGDQSLYTAFGAVNGTPLYMAPEQATFNALDVDTRADVYSLGVILYELLSGSTPIERDTLRRAGLEEMFRVIREVEPPTPSNRISTSEALPNVAAARHIEPVRLSRFVRGDLDWIVMKALAKERDRRYDSAIGLANDVERFVNHEPVSAGPPTASYRFRKFVRRHRPQVIAAALVFLTLVGGIVGTTWGLFRAEAQRILAEQATAAETAQRIEAESQHKKALEAERRATLEAAKATAVNEFLTQDLLMQAEPANNAAEDHVTLIQVLDRAADRVGERFAGQPEVESAVRRTIANTYHGLASWRKSEEQWRAILEIERKATPVSPGRYLAQSALVHVLWHNGRRDAETLAMAQETADEVTRSLGPDHRETLNCMNNLVQLYRAVGQLERATVLSEETLARMRSQLGPDDPDTLNCMINLASAYLSSGRFERALPLIEETLALTKSKLGPDHPYTLASMNNLADGYRAAGRLEEAMALYEESFTLTKAKFGPDHPNTLKAMGDLGGSYGVAGRLDRALPLFEKTLALTKSKLGPDHPNTLAAMNNLANGYRAAGRLEEALSLYEESFALMKAKLGHDALNTLKAMGNLIKAYGAAGRVDRALSLFEEALPLMKARLGPDHPTTLDAIGSMGAIHLQTGRPAEAISLLEKSYRASRKHPALGWVASVLLAAYIQAGRTDEAVTLARENLAEARISLPADSPQLAGEMAQLGLVLLMKNAWTDAEPILREALAVREAKQPDAWSTFNSKSMLGGSLLGQEKYADAEPLLRAGYEGMKQRADEIPPPARIRVSEALDRLIQLAEATDKPEDAKMWKDEKAKLADPSSPKPQPERK